MPRRTKWQDMDEEDRLPHGVKRSGYDQARQQYTFTTHKGEILVGQPGRRFSELIRTGPVNRSATTPVAFSLPALQTQGILRAKTSEASLASYTTEYAESINEGEELPPRTNLSPTPEETARPCSSVYSKVSPTSTMRRGSSSTVSTTPSPSRVSPISSLGRSPTPQSRPNPMFNTRTPTPVPTLANHSRTFFSNQPIFDNGYAQNNRIGSLRRSASVRRRQATPTPQLRAYQQRQQSPRPPLQPLSARPLLNQAIQTQTWPQPPRPQPQPQPQPQQTPPLPPNRPEHQLMRQYLHTMQTPDGEQHVRQQLSQLRHTALHDRQFQQALREVAPGYPPERVAKLAGFLERCASPAAATATATATGGILEEEGSEEMRAANRGCGGGGGGPGGEGVRGDVVGRRTELDVAGQGSGRATPSMDRPMVRRVMVGRAAKELLSDTVAYFGHLLTSVLVKSSNSLKRKNGKRLAKLGLCQKEEERVNMEFLEWLEAAKRKAEMEDNTEGLKDNGGR